MNLESHWNNLITSGLGLTDLEIARRMRVLNLFHLAFIMIAPLLGLFYFYIGAITLFHGTVAAGFLMILSMVLLRKTRNIRWCGNLAIFVAWALLFVIVWNTEAITIEGMINPGLILNACLVLLAIFFGGYLWGTVWASVVFLETGLMVYLYLMRFQFPNQIPIQISAVYHLGTFLAALSVMVLLSFLFEREKEEALLREEGKAQALRESNKYVDDILERSPVATFIIDRSHRVVQWNSACQKMTGVESKDILGKRVCESFRMNAQGSIADMVIDAPEAVQESYEDSILSKTDLGWYELDIVLPNLKGGQRSIVTAAPILDDQGTIRGAIQSLQEVKSLQWELEEMGWDHLNEAFVSPVFKVDSQGTITFWNRACEETFGRSASDMKGKSAVELVSHKYRFRFREALERALRGDPVKESAWRYEKGEGSPVYVIARVYPLRRRDRDEKECLVVNTDITELTLKMKKMELYSAENKEKLRNLMEEHQLLKTNIASFIRKKQEG
jgi:PAS domain S-box-containing protein